MQVGKKSYQEEDVAPEPLFTSVDPNVFQTRRTYSAFCSLLDNYERWREVPLFFSPVKAVRRVCKVHCVEHVPAHAVECTVALKVQDHRKG